MSGCGCGMEARDRSQQRVLIVLLLINGLMFVLELGLGLMAESTGLIADSLDMLADAMVYGIGLYAVGRSIGVKIRAARLSGLFQILLAIGVAGDVLRRLIVGSEPVSLLMIGVGIFALIANVACLALMARHRAGDVHMRASWIFSANDVLANLGVISAGLLVMVLDSRLPDLIIGALITLLVLRGGLQILREARKEVEGQSLRH